MSGLVEKVATAMAEATNGGKWDDGHYCEDHKALWMKRARAAIEAMREPAAEMLSIAEGYTLQGQREPGDWFARQMWGEMIDAALSA